MQRMISQLLSGQWTWSVFIDISGLNKSIFSYARSQFFFLISDVPLFQWVFGDFTFFPNKKVNEERGSPKFLPTRDGMQENCKGDAQDKGRGRSRGWQLCSRSRAMSPNQSWPDCFTRNFFWKMKLLENLFWEVFHTIWGMGLNQW